MGSKTKKFNSGIVNLAQVLEAAYPKVKNTWPSSATSKAEAFGAAAFT